MNKSFTADVTLLFIEEENKLEETRRNFIGIIKGLDN